jgi:glycerol-3-phosphate dehydrogenase
LSYAAQRFPEDQNSPSLLQDDTTVKMADLRYAAQHEHVTSLVDLLFRRVHAGWTAGMAAVEAESAARAVADILGWDEAEMENQVREYRSYLARQHSKNWEEGVRAAQ